MESDIVFGRDGINWDRCNIGQDTSPTMFVQEHKEEIDTHYYDEVDKYCERNFITPYEYFDKCCGMMDPYPEKFSYSRIDVKAHEMESKVDPVRPEKDHFIPREQRSLGDIIRGFTDYLNGRNDDKDRMTEAEREGERARQISFQRSNEERTVQEEREQSHFYEEPEREKITRANYAVDHYNPKEDPRFDNAEDRFYAMTVDLAQYKENRSIQIAKELEKEDKEKGIDRPPGYDYHALGTIIAHGNYFGEDVSREMAERTHEEYMREEATRDVSRERENLEKGVWAGPDYLHDKEHMTSTGMARDIEEHVREAREIFYNREVDKYCEEHEISREEYNEIVKNTDRDQLHNYSPEEMNPDRTMEERRSIIHDRIEADKAEQEKELEKDREKDPDREYDRDENREKDDPEPERDIDYREKDFSPSR